MRSSAGQRPLLILGTGLSGSLLVEALARHPAPGPVQLIDARPRPTAERAWAGFGPQSRSSGHQLHRVRINGPRGTRTLPLRDHVYFVREGSDLADRSDQAARALGAERIVAHVDWASSTRRHVLVKTSGRVLNGSWAFDSTTDRHVGSRRGTPMRMHFLGRRIETDHPVFDVDTVTLMDFTVPQRGQLRFAYVLPETASRALVELTVLSPHGMPPVKLAADLTDYVDALVGAAWSTRGEESGCLPLEPRRARRRHGRVLDIGARGGLIRSSTGYGLHLMTQDADRIAAQLAAGRRPRGLRRRRRYAAMDAVMLHLIATRPDAAAAVLESLFARNPVDRIVRFLDEESTLLDDLRIGTSLPPGSMVRAGVELLLNRAAAHTPR